MLNPSLKLMRFFYYAIFQCPDLMLHPKPFKEIISLLLFKRAPNRNKKKKKE